MGLWTRVKSVVLADLHDLIDRCEDPISMTKQYLRELEEQMQQAQQALAQQWLAERRYELLIKQAEEKIEKRERQAKLAVEKKEEAIAKMALQEKIAYEKKLEWYQQQYTTLQEKTTYLKEQLNKLKETYDELSAKQLDLIARSYTAQAVKAIHASLTPFAADRALRGFARMEERILALEAEAQASRYVSEWQQMPSLSPLLQQEVEQQLTKLKEAK